MMALLWLITTALGLRLIYEQSYDVRRLTGLRIRKALLYATFVWVVGLVRTALWFITQ
jgi:hypothetical protein